MKKTTKTMTPPAPATKKSVSKKTAAPAVKNTAAKSPSATVITVHSDVGFGNTLYLRGNGPGLSWDKGVPLDCLADDRWSITVEHDKPFAFKFLLNDLLWCSGEDYTAKPASNLSLTPVF